MRLEEFVVISIVFVGAILTFNFLGIIDTFGTVNKDIPNDCIVNVYETNENELEACEKNLQIQINKELPEHVPLFPFFCTLIVIGEIVLGLYFGGVYLYHNYKVSKK